MLRPTHGFGRTNAATHPSSARPAQLGHGRVHVLERHHGRREEAVGRGRAVAGEPVVVGPRERRRGSGIAEPPEAQADRRVEHHGVDALDVQVLHAGDGIEGARARLLERHRV